MFVAGFPLVDLESMALPTGQHRRGFKPTLFERLFDQNPRISQDAVALRQWSVDELKDSVAKDVESLLNSRAGLRASEYVDFAEIGRSVLSFGMSDFVGLSLASPADRNLICATLERTIQMHEPRLRSIQVELDVDATSVNALRFSISAQLHVHPTSEPVNFDAVLRPSSLQYSVARGNGVVR